MGDVSMRIVCVRARTADLTVRGAVATRQCCECAHYVLTAPSSESMLRSNVAIEIVCLDCHAAKVPKAAIHCVSKEAPEEIKGMIPNPWKDPN